MQKSLRRKIEQAFYNYEANKRIAVDELIDDLVSKMTTVSYGGISVKSSPQNTVENALINLCDKELTAYKWCKVVENTLTKYAYEYKDELIRLKYFKRLKNEQAWKKLHIEERTFYRWKDEILNTACEFARELKLI